MGFVGRSFGAVLRLPITFECLAKKRINKPKTSIKHRTNKEKTIIKLITEPAFLPNTCYSIVVDFKKNIMLTVLIRYKKWNSSGHALLDDYQSEHSEVVQVEKLTELNEKYKNIISIQTFYDAEFLEVFEQMLNCLEEAKFYQRKPTTIIDSAKKVLMNTKRSNVL